MSLIKDTTPLLWLEPVAVDIALFILLKINKEALEHWYGCGNYLIEITKTDTQRIQTIIQSSFLEGMST